MKHDALKHETPVQTETHGDPGSGSGMLEDAQSLWHELRGLTHDRFRLAALETQRAGKSLVDIIVVGVMIGVLLIGACLGLMASMASWQRSATAAVASNLLIALILFGVIRS